ncbi:MAG: hypothetical protein V4702_05425 [Patescibacteria group bacterium]
MDIIKKIGRVFASYLLRFTLLALAIIVGLIAVFGTPGPIKKALENSGIYDSFIDNILKESQKQQTAGDIPVERQEVVVAAKTAFQPDFLRGSTEDVIDSTYDWLNKKASKPEFRIDLTGPKQKFVNSLGDYAVERAKSLPACTLQQLIELRSTVDPFNAPCLPAGLTAESLRSQVVDEVNSQDEFLKESVITADHLGGNEQGSKPFEQATQIPEAFYWMKLAPMLLAVISILSAAMLVYFHDNRRRGLRSVGMSLMGTGVFLAVFSGLLSFLFGQANKPGGSFGKAINNEFQQTALSVIGSLSGTYGLSLMIVGGIYGILGAIIWYTLKRTEPKTEATADSTPTNDTSSTPPSSSPQTPLPGSTSQ